MLIEPGYRWGLVCWKKESVINWQIWLASQERFIIFLFCNMYRQIHTHLCIISGQSSPHLYLGSINIITQIYLFSGSQDLNSTWLMNFYSQAAVISNQSSNMWRWLYMVNEFLFPGSRNQQPVFQHVTLTWPTYPFAFPTHLCIWRYILQNYNYKLHFQNLFIYDISYVSMGTLAVENLDVCTTCDPWNSNIQLTMGIGRRWQIGQGI